MAKNKSKGEEVVKVVKPAIFKTLEIIPCAECGGQGLKDTTQLCGVCAGTGKSN